MAAKQMHYTKEGYQALVDELDYLKTVRRAEVKEALATARSYGDLSENSEYDEAKTEQGRVEGRIHELEEILATVIVVDGDQKADAVDVGATVVVNNVTKGKTFEYTIVGATESNPLQGKISDRSPIGKALMGCRVGAKVDVETPAGVISLEIVDIK